MPLIAIVSSDDLDTTDLRARRYVFSPSHEARELVDDWCRMHKVLNRRSQAVKDLEAAIASKLRLALEERKP